MRNQFFTMLSIVALICLSMLYDTDGTPVQHDTERGNFSTKTRGRSKTINFLKKSLLVSQKTLMHVRQHIADIDQHIQKLSAKNNIMNIPKETRIKLYPDATGGTDDYCITKGCVLAAVNLLNSIDEHADPCQNFYKFACGKWIQDNPLPEDETFLSPSLILYNRVRLQLRTLLEDDSEQKIVANSIRFTKALYKACMNIDQIEHLKSKPIHNFLNKIGGWPVINSTWKDDGMDFTALNIMITRQFGSGIFTPHHVDIDIDQVLPYLDEYLLLDDEKYGTEIAAYKELYMDTVQLIASDMNISISLDRIGSYWMEVINFDKQLAKIVATQQEEDNRSELYNAYNLRNFSALINIVNWTQYFESVLPAEVFENAIKDRADQFVFYVHHPKHFEELKLLLSTVKKDIPFQKFVFGSDNQGNTKWRKCLQDAMEVQYASGALYVRNYFREEDKQQANTMVDNLKDSFKSLIRRAKWMDKATRNEAMNKLESMVKHIGYPDLVFNDSALDKFYNNLSYEENASYFELHQTLIHWSQARDYFKILESVDKHEFPENPALVNGVYHPFRNSITFPAAILQPPVFHNSYPKELPVLINSSQITYKNMNIMQLYNLTSHFLIMLSSNENLKIPEDVSLSKIFRSFWYYTYALMGTIVGHEISHGFDHREICIIIVIPDAFGFTQDASMEGEMFFSGMDIAIGHQFDEKGSLRNWWSESSKKNFEERTNCMRNQYGNYLESSVQEYVDGNLTIGENMADNGGLKTAITAYAKYVKLMGKQEKRLPGLNLTVIQAFFTSYAMYYCSNIDEGLLLQYLKTDPHSPNEFRVNGVVSNFPLFAKAFGCPKGSPMNPEKKCSVW